ncbi:ABC transporter ATP-binding protein [Pelomicrobium methylotrophicum]|uniref:ABC transporter ATP-binding protein n=1 Tax=Pelomicrobium methylotrophicum TaxID=2602750 RepID=A0A5C7EK78_9PROT|nr:ABC transporter ATP-binding protein [Pelomicrobium methylotrophicum]TXF11433.1 ABC transporter ATP-binding protein [Pelomicrobium methylotrophicum]
MAESLAVLRNVEKNYPTANGAVVALSKITLEISRHDYLCLMGPSGSGKTTLLNILGGIDQPNAGEVFLDGQRIDKLSEQELLPIRRRKVAYVFQEARLMPSLTALENVLLPSAFAGGDDKQTQERALALLRKVGLEKRAHHLAHQLSGGEAQRVCIARALLNRPLLILADEPTGNLDHATRLEIVRLLENIYEEGGTVVMVTHDPELGRRARRRIVIHDGRIQEEASDLFA